MFVHIMYSVIRECRRVLRRGNNVSLIIEPIMPFDSDFIDLPFFSKSEVYRRRIRDYF